jgi:hypothetical protein
MMAGLSDHTLIMNLMVGFSKDFSGFPSPLKNAGYRLERIEPDFVNSEGKAVNPDLVFSSNGSLKGLIFELKDSHIEDETLEKYQAITGTEIQMVVEDVHDISRLEAELAFAGSGKMEESFDHPEIGDMLNNIPGLVFQEDVVKLRNKFEEGELNDEFNELELPNTPPTQFYPFSPNDAEGLIAGKLCQEIMYEIANSYGDDEVKFEAKDLVSSSHNFWESISPEGKKELVSRAETIIENLMENGLDEHLEKIQGEKSFSVQSTKAFRNKANDVLAEFDSQQSLRDYGGEEDE